MARLTGSLTSDGVFRKAVVCAAASLLAVSLSACADLPMLGQMSDGTDVSEDRVASLRTGAATPPALRPGDRFTYGNPDVTWQVIAQVDEGRLAWQASDGSTQITALDPLMPALEWNSPTTGAGRRLISARSEPLFPLEVGKRVAFRSTVDSDAPPYAWEFDWSCEVLPIEEVTVPAGTFLTYPVNCGRGTGDDTKFYYSPVVGNYVRVTIENPDGGAPVIRDLLSYSRGDGAMRLADAEIAPEVGEVTTEESDDGRAIMSAEPASNVASRTNGSSGGAPMALGMLSGVEPAPAQAPQSEIMTDGAARTETADTIGDTTRFDPNNTAAPETQGTAALQDATSTGQGVSDGRTVAVHLASYLNPDNAEVGWGQLMENNRDQLNGTRPMIRQVDLGSQGIFFRLHAGPISGEAQAAEICRVLTARGVYCQVTRL